MAADRGPGRDSERRDALVIAVGLHAETNGQPLPSEVAKAMRDFAAAEMDALAEHEDADAGACLHRGPYWESLSPAGRGRLGAKADAHLLSAKRLRARADALQGGK